jgi:alkylhydroperoxidase family enzyme
MSTQTIETFLPPMEKPEGLMQKLAYYFTRRQFGKVLTPLKVHSARLPSAFGLFYAKISKLDKKLTLPRETVFLIREHVARINICLFCTDIGRWFSIQESMEQAKFDALEQYETSPLFTEAERAALDYAAELTRNKQVNPNTFARVSSHYSERAICEIVWLVASEHLYNLTNIGLNIHSDMLCDVTRRTKSDLCRDFSTRLRRDVMKTVPTIVSPIARARETCVAGAAKSKRPSAITSRPVLAPRTNLQPPNVVMKATSVFRRGVDLVGWIVPAAIVALTPKCPLCFAAYVAAWTGIGLSGSVATHLRWSLLILSSAVILFLTARATRRLIHKFGQCERVMRRCAVC